MSKTRMPIYDRVAETGRTFPTLTGAKVFLALQSQMTTSERIQCGSLFMPPSYTDGGKSFSGLAISDDHFRKDSVWKFIHALYKPIKV